MLSWWAVDASLQLLMETAWGSNTRKLHVISYTTNTYYLSLIHI